MKVKIEIECDTINQIHSHFIKIMEDVRKKTAELKLNPSEDEFPKRFNLDDDNCYGEHTVKIYPS